MKKITFILYIAFALTLATCVPVPPPQSFTTDSGLTVAPDFEGFYNRYDGLRTLGNPISPEILENGIRVQYFESGRLEYHPQLPEGSQVILSNLGKELYGIEPCLPVENVEPGALYFSSTCHSVSPQFSGFFLEYGGVSFFGYPISEMYIRDGRFVQHFERATIVWHKSELPEYGFNLAGIGSRVCPQSICGDLPPGPYAPAFSESLPKPVDATAIQSFYESHNGQTLFGAPIGGPHLSEDGVVEQVYENVILYTNPSAAEKVSLRPLGLTRLGAADGPVPQTDAPNSFYSNIYGHNVTGAIYTFFSAHGGLDFFGHPLTEMRIEDGYLVQYFENTAITWRSTSQGSQLHNLGQLSSTQNFPSVSNLPVPSNPPKMLSLTTQPVYAAYDVYSGLPQTLKALVRDENRAPIPGANVVFTVKTPNGDQQYASVTNADGTATASFTLNSYKATEPINYSARVSYGHLSTSNKGQFLPWAKPK